MKKWKRKGREDGEEKVFYLGEAEGRIQVDRIIGTGCTVGVHR